MLRRHPSPPRPAASRALGSLTAALALAVVLLVVGVTGVVGAVGDDVADGTAEPGGELRTVVALDFAPHPSPVPWSRATEALHAAAREGADFVVLPRLALAGPPGTDGPAAEPLPGPTSRFFGRLANSLDLWIGLTLAEEGPEGHWVTAVLLDPDGELVYRHRRVATPSTTDGARRGDPRRLLVPAVAGDQRLAVVAGADLPVVVPQAAERGAATVLVSGDWSADQAAAVAATCADLSRKYHLTLVVADGGGRVTGVWRHGSRVGRPEAVGDPAATARSARFVLEDPDPAVVPASAVTSATAAPLPLGLPPLAIPPHRPLDPRRVELGRQLFFDAGLSRTGEVSCASCHQPQRAFADGRARGQGVDARQTRRNVPSLLNVAYRAALFWDGRATTLESQAKYPLSDAAEMDFHYLDRAVEMVRAHPSYPARFREAFDLAPDEALEFDHLAQALAAYQRTLVSGGSAFDRFLYGGDGKALSEAAVRGMELFAGRAGCAQCHTVERHWALFQDHRFHNTGVGWDPRRGTFSDPGVGLVADQAGFFLTPSLRNVALTPPYMHDGSLPTLEAVVGYYDRGGNANPGLDPKLRPLGLTKREKTDLVAFLEALTSEEDRGLAGTVAAVGLAPARGILAAATDGRSDGRPVPGSAPADLSDLAKRVRRAALSGATVMVLPAGSLEAGELERLTCATGLWLAMAPAEGGMALFTPEAGLHHRQAALHPPGTSREDALAGRAFRDLRRVDTPAGRLGLLSGEDVLLGLPRMAELGADAVLVSADWPLRDPLARAERVHATAERLGLTVVVADLSGARSSLRDVPAPTATARPLGLPPLPARGLGSPQGAERWADEWAELGQRLFFDPGLSADGRVSCATCHEPAHRFTDGRKLPEGVAGRRGEHNVPSVVNSAYKPFLFWRGDVRTLEDQVLQAVEGYAEMDTRRDRAVAYVASREDYRRDFARLTGRAEPTFDDLAGAIAAYERSLLSAASPFDLWYYGGRRDAVSAEARRGFELFRGTAGCADCHTVGEDGALFSDGRHHNTGVGFHPRFLYLGYGGDGVEGNVATGNEFRGEYLTPSLRDIALTAPYMHDGSLATLAEVVDFYNRGGVANPHLDRKIRPLGLSDADRRALVAFLETLSGEPPPARLTADPFAVARPDDGLGEDSER